MIKQTIKQFLNQTLIASTIVIVGSSHKLKIKCFVLGKAAVESSIFGRQLNLSKRKLSNLLIKLDALF